MKERTLNFIVLGAAFALIGFAFYVGCRALNNDRMLWLFAAAGVQSPRGADISAAPPLTVSVILTWNAAQDAPVDGYRVYVRKSGQRNSDIIDVGTSRIVQISGLERKTTYRVYVTAYRSDLESKPSEELSFRTPLKPGQNAEEL